MLHLRDWADKVEAEVPGLVQEMLPPQLRPAAPEVWPYLTASFGDKTRIGACASCSAAALWAQACALCVCVPPGSGTLTHQATGLGADSVGVAGGVVAAWCRLWNRPRADVCKWMRNVAVHAAAASAHARHGGADGHGGRCGGGWRRCASWSCWRGSLSSRSAALARPGHEA
jgi:hypothetical protein